MFGWSVGWWVCYDFLKGGKFDDFRLPIRALIIACLTFRSVDPPDLPAVFAVVVDEHVLADAQQARSVNLIVR